MHFTFDRDESDNLSGDQILFAAYENMSDGTAVAKAGIRSGEFFYEIGSEEINGVNMSALNDVSVSNPHIAIIVYDSRRQKVILNIDGAEVISKNIKPISGISKISRIEFGENYTGEMGMMYTYATKLSIDERVELVGMLAQSVNTKVIKPKIDERGVLVSGVDKEASVQCRPGKIFINGNCQNAVISGFTAPLNSAYDGDSNGDITYDPAHKGMDNAKLLDCNIGYQVGDAPPKYWFEIENNLPIAKKSGECIARNYSANFLGIAGISNDLTSVIYSNSSNTPLPCQSGYSSHSEDGYSFDNVTGDITVDSDSGGCAPKSFTFGSSGNVALPNNANGPSMAVYDASLTGGSSVGAINCDNDYEASSDLGYYFNGATLAVQGSCNQIVILDCETAAIGSVGDPSWNDCANMLIVDKTMLDKAVADRSYNFKPSDSYTNHNNGITYTFANSSNTIFTGRVNNMYKMFYEVPSFSGDISHWDTSKVTNMQKMFYKANFNGNVSDWNVSSVTSMYQTFYKSTFNGDISNWDTSKVTNMRLMFYGSAFNQDISGWCVKNVADSSSFSTGSPLQTAFHPPFGDSTSTNCN